MVIAHLAAAGNLEAAGLAAEVESQVVVGSLVVGRVGTVAFDHSPRRAVEGAIGRLPRVLRVDLGPCPGNVRRVAGWRPRGVVVALQGSLEVQAVRLRCLVMRCWCRRCWA